MTWGVNTRMHVYGEGVVNYRGCTSMSTGGEL